MFVDMRGSTNLAESRLPFDTVFIVNRFLDAVSQVVIACGGQPNQFVGDGQLALFGLATDPPTACRQAPGGRHDFGQCRRSKPASEAVRVTAGLAPDALPEPEVAIRGRAEPDARTLSEQVNDLDDGAAWGLFRSD